MLSHMSLTRGHRNIWNTSTQREIVEALGEKYGFSERLRSLMKIKTPPVTKPQPASLRQTGASTRNSRKPASTSTESALERGENAEKTGSARQNPPQTRPKMPVAVGEDIQLYFLLKETVNYFSIDHTDRGKNNAILNIMRLWNNWLISGQLFASARTGFTEDQRIRYPVTERDSCHLSIGYGSPSATTVRCHHNLCTLTAHSTDASLRHRPLFSRRTNHRASSSRRGP